MRRLAASRGFSLAELMVALVIAGIIGVALTRLVVSQARFVASQDGRMRSRAVARAGLAVMVEELRQVDFGGVQVLSRDSITVRVPFVVGVACNQSGGATNVAILPPDSTRYAGAFTAGYAWRDTIGGWHFVEPATQTVTSGSGCISVGVAAPKGPNGSSTVLSVSPNQILTPVGAAVYLYQRVTYFFGPSTEMPGRTALWRYVAGSTGPEELASPYDTSTRFRFLVGKGLVMQTTVPVLDSLRGVSVKLVAASERPPAGQNVPSTFTITSNIVFRNREQ